jgi:hypothetical protein
LPKRLSKDEIAKPVPPDEKKCIIKGHC